MILDLLLGTWLIMAGLLGARDGIVRKAVSAVMCIIALILSQAYMREAADVLVESAGVDPVDAPLLGALAIFFGLMLIQSLVYRFATGPYKIGGIADRIGGAVIGLGQGVLFVSSFLFLMAMVGFPSKGLKRDSRIYKAVVNIAPQILDEVMTVGPETFEQLKDLSSPDADAADAKKAAAARRAPASGMTNADSIRAAARR